jgi:hypothetical protein
MNEYVAIADIQSVLSKQRLLPTIMMWNRLECRPRTKDFDRALQAEVRDALWMLTKQWQMGEFKADDAGSPVTAKMHMATTRLTKYQADGHSVQSFNEAVPLEAQVEQRPIPLFSGKQEIALDIRLLMGRQWLKWLTKAGLSDVVRREFIREYAIARPDPDQRGTAPVCAHQTAWQKFAAAADRMMDGAKLYLYLTELATHRAYDNITSTPLEKAALAMLEMPFINWFQQLFYQPTNPGNDAWLPQRLEYQFACSAPVGNSEKILSAEEYYQGHLDWYNFSVDQTRSTLGPVVTNPPIADVQATITRSFMPNPVRFEGMPHTRWWRFEDGKTNFGDIKPDTTDLNKLMLIEFGLVYANDWFLLPVTLASGSLCDIKGLAVSNVFGERFWIESSSQGQDEDPQRWTMYSQNIAGHANVPADMSILIAPAIPKILEGKPLEEIYLIRDEVANMVWGVETQITLPSGDSMPGREAALQMQRHYQRLVAQENLGQPPPAAAEPVAAIRYQLMNSVPENWIPFMPVHKDNDNREIQLQRASMPRIIEGDTKPIEKIKPRTALLREGLAANPAQAYYIYEEEVPRAGARVCQSFQRTRWYGGKVVTWLGVRKLTGRGEGASGLAYDLIVPTKKVE